MRQAAGDYLWTDGDTSPAVRETVQPSLQRARSYSVREIGYCFVKRLFDIVSSLAALIVLSPLIGACLLIKWLEDGHSPIYVSYRVTKGGRIFRFYKIRSMEPDADSEKQRLIETGQNEADGPVFKMKDDPRITPFGRWLRHWNIDELLQLWNVLKGDMSVVGPRPPLPVEVEDYTPHQMERLSVKGGLLCLWQIQPDRHGLTFDQWVELDLEYIRQRSLLMDLMIILRGAFMVFSGKSGD